MSARDDYAKLDHETSGPHHMGQTSKQGQQALDELDRLRAEVERLKACILDIDAHATPLGEDADGFVSVGYVVSVGAVHRALGAVGHSSAKCKDLDCERAVELRTETDELRRTLVDFRNAVAQSGARDDATIAALRAEVERMRPVIEAARAYAYWLQRQAAGERSFVGPIRDRIRASVAALDAGEPCHAVR